MVSDLLCDAAALDFFWDHSGVGCKYADFHRHKLGTPLNSNITGIRMVVHGNSQKYFVHLRTKGTVLPWQYYQASFNTTNQWSEIRLPLSIFKPSGRMLRSKPAQRRLHPSASWRMGVNMMRKSTFSKSTFSKPQKGSTTDRPYTISPASNRPSQSVASPKTTFRWPASRLSQPR